mmetsp:Transcript_31105/g.88831  ORF Transcript_31105/g.88831 Transcript_31105/m.88831 type:complete len:91 (+) Transcript_31105:297-569(+)
MSLETENQRSNNQKKTKNTGKENGSARIVDTFTIVKNALECTLKSKALDSAAPNARDPVVVTRRKLGIELELPWTEEMHPFLSFLLEVWH